MFGVFRVKNHDFTPKNYIFSNFRGGARRVLPPPESAPAMYSVSLTTNGESSNQDLGEVYSINIV